jgi:hypothetical protein
MTDSDRTQRYGSAPQPGGYPGSYPPPPPTPYAGYTAPPAPPKNGPGTAALVIAILALATVWTVVGGIALGIAAVIIGIAARGRVSRGEADNGGVATGGIALGGLAVAIGLLFTAIWFNVYEEVGGDDYVSCLQNANHDNNAIKQCEDHVKDRIQKKFGITLSTAPTT